MRMPNGFGGIINLGGNRRKPFAVRVTVGFEDDGRQRFKYIGYYEKRTDALTALVEFNKNPYDLNDMNVTFEEVFERWSSRKFEKLGSSSVRNYKSYFRKCKTLHSMPIRSIRTHHLQSVIDDNENLAHISLMKVLFNQLFSYAITHDICEKDYSQALELPVKKTKKKKTPFTTDEIQTLWKHKDEPFVDLVLILLYTGMRISELLEMRIDRIHLSDRYMVGGLKTEAGIDRMIPIHKDVLPLVKAQINEGKKYLFETARGNKHAYNYFASKKFSPLMKKLKMKHTLHETRHTFVSQADRLGLNSTAVKRIIGHADADVTDRYTHKEFSELVEVIDAFFY